MRNPQILSNKRNFLVINKIDLLEKPNLLSSTAQINASYDFHQTFMISALKNKGDMQISYGIINNRTVPVKISLKLSKGVIVLKLKKSSNIIN